MTEKGEENRGAGGTERETDRQTDRHSERERERERDELYLEYGFMRRKKKG